MERRRMMMSQRATSGGDWTYELHLTPEWEVPMWPGEPYHVEMNGDFSELYQFLMDMCLTLGYLDETTWILDNIPNECNITVDGKKLTNLMFYGADYLDLSFEGDCYGILGRDYLFLEKYATSEPV